MTLTLCVLLWAVPDMENALIEYEDQVLELLPAHGARLLTRVRTREGEPFEVQVLEFPSEQALTDYIEDPRRVALSEARDRAVARTETLHVDVVAHQI